MNKLQAKQLTPNTLVSIRYIGKNSGVTLTGTVKSVWPDGTRIDINLPTSIKFGVPCEIVHVLKKWHLEIRRSSDGAIEGTDTIEGTEQDAMQDAKNWLIECLSLDTYQKEILVIDVATEECVYQGTFDLAPTKLEIGNYIAVTFEAETVNDDNITQFEDITEYGTVIRIEDDKVTIADELDMNGKPTKDSQWFEFSTLTAKVEIIHTEFQPYVIFHLNNYLETVIMEHNGCRIVDCSELGITQMYRVEWSKDYCEHKAVYTSPDAMNLFKQHQK